MDDAEQAPELRISDAERHAVAEILREAAGEGRLDFDELDERLEATYAARTYADLVPITVDLPSAATPTGRETAVPSEQRTASGPVVVGGAGKGRRVRNVAILGGFERKGVWTVPERMTITTFMGGAELDLRQARFAARDVTITVNAFMGGAGIIVGPGVDVVVDGTGIMGSYSGPSDRVDAELTADSPTLRIRGIAVWGAVSVKRKPDVDPRRKSLRRR